MKLKHIVAFLVFVAAIVGLLTLLSGEKSPRIPDDGRHEEWTVEERCLDCHGPDGEAPRGRRHPPKDQCLECHKVKDDRRRAVEGKAPGS